MDPLTKDGKKPHPLCSSPVDIITPTRHSTSLSPLRPLKQEDSKDDSATTADNNIYDDNNPKDRTRDGANNDNNSGAASPLTVPSDDEDIGGVTRLIPDPDSPTSRLLQRAAERALLVPKLGTPDGTKRFSFLHDIARNSRLSQAAQAELHAAASGNSTPLSHTSNTSARTIPSQMEFLQHGVELDRQTAVINELDADAEEESRINEGMASIMLTRLKSGCITSERVLSILQALASAESAYYRAMEAVSKVSLVGECDGPRLRTAMEEFSDIPLLVAAAHTSIGESLGDGIKAVQAVVSVLRIACEEVGQGAATAQRAVQAARKSIKSALIKHQEACKDFDAAVLERKRDPKGRLRGVENDPWVTEGRLVEQQAALQRAQTEQRRYLAQAFKRAEELERRRVIEVTAALRLCLKTYKGSETAVKEQGERIQALLSAVDPDTDLQEFNSVATKAVKNGDALSGRQAELVHHLWTELVTSAEIVRQGEMERRLPTGDKQWVPGYAVLTKAGFVHWFAAAKGSAPAPWGPSGGPTESFNLSKCIYEQGDASAIRLSEPSTGWLSGRSRSLYLRTADVEECMDWALECRERMIYNGR